MIKRIEEILGDEAESLLTYHSNAIPKERLHLPGPGLRVGRGAWVFSSARRGLALVVATSPATRPARALTRRGERLSADFYGDTSEMQILRRPGCFAQDDAFVRRETSSRREMVPLRRGWLLPSKWGVVSCVGETGVGFVDEDYTTTFIISWSTSLRGITVSRRENMGSSARTTSCSRALGSMGMGFMCSMIS